MHANLHVLLGVYVIMHVCALSLTRHLALCVYTLTLTQSLTAHPNAARGLNEGARKAIYFARIERILYVWLMLSRTSVLSRRELELRSKVLMRSSCQVCAGILTAWRVAAVELLSSRHTRIIALRRVQCVARGVDSLLARTQTQEGLGGARVRRLVLDISGVNFIDSSAMHTLHGLVHGALFHFHELSYEMKNPHKPTRQQTKDTIALSHITHTHSLPRPVLAQTEIRHDDPDLEIAFAGAKRNCRRSILKVRD